MSHEIRTPMNAITGFNQLMLGTELTDKQKDYVNKSQSAAYHLLGIINEILDFFSKIESGKMTLEAIGFNLFSVIDNIKYILLHRADEKKLDFVIDVSPSLNPNLIGDPLKLAQVIINLGGNAIKFTEKGFVKIQIEDLGCSEGFCSIRFSVVDSGIGIKEDVIPKLFNEFIQAESSTTRMFGGTGLGLTISQKLVNLMGGHIEIDSVYGEGSKFSFKLKYKVDESVQGSEIKYFGNSYGLLFRTEDVLTDSNIQFIDNIVKKIDVAEGLEEALAMSKSHNVDDEFYNFVIIDKIESEQLELLNYLQMLGSKNNKTHIIVLEGGELDEDINERYPAMQFRILSKPIIPSELINVVHEASKSYSTNQIYRRMSEKKAMRVSF